MTPTALVTPAEGPAQDLRALGASTIWRATRLPAVLGLLSAGWFFLLSWHLLGLPATSIADNVDHFFDADPGTRSAIIVGVRHPRHAEGGARATMGQRDGAAEGSPQPGGFRIPRHPFAGRLWPILGRPVHALTSLGFEEPAARIHAARVVSALVGGFGVACLSVLIGLQRVHWSYTVLATIIYLGFSSHAITAIPELIGLSSGLLSATLLLSRLPLRPAIKIPALAGLALALGGTTIVLALFPLLCLLWLHPAIGGFSPAVFVRRHWRAALGILAAVLIVGALSSARLLEAFWSAGGWQRVGLAREDVRWMTTDRLANPAAAISYAVLGLVYPAVAPTPDVELRDPRKDAPYLALTYEPWRLQSYGWLNGLGAAGWTLLLGLSVWQGLRRPSERPTLRLLGVWLVFNLTMHLVWGREIFLYTPHWAWAAFALTIGGVATVPRRLLVVLALAIAAGQLATLWAMVQLVEVAALGP